ncbi:MAG: helix-hairpin-helix domain-containing protein [Candidatus Rokubacteria bacterium]|nr:helix-hairpin-helix domain-containing protein [Candidatus Rokubacteria bacterium]
MVSACGPGGRGARCARGWDGSAPPSPRPGSAWSTGARSWPSSASSSVAPWSGSGSKRSTGAPPRSSRPLARPRGDRSRSPHRITAVREAAPAPASDAPRLDLNAAPTSALERLPGIGPRLARRIVEERERAGPFRSAQDLRRVRGIGPKTVETLAPLVTVEAGEGAR